MNIKISGKQISLSIIFALAYLAFFLLFVFWSEPLFKLREIVGTQGGFSAPIAYITLAFLSVVLAPVTIAPLIPVASIVFGPVLAGIYSITGWFLGSVAAFLIARHVGRPILKRFVSLERVKEYESYIPEEMELWAVLLLRMVIPVDLLSYALGLLSKIKLWKYSLASLLAIIPFAFIFAFAGGALVYKNLTLLISSIGVGLVIFAFVAYLFYHHGGVKEKLERRVKREDER